MTMATRKQDGPRIVALQMKRIGDLLLTTPALAALRARQPEARIILCGSPVASVLAPALPMVDGVIGWRGGPAGALDALRVFGQARGRGGLALDFTGTDRSAVATIFSRAQERRSFAWMERKGRRSRLYTELVESSVRERHTVDHYLDLVGGPLDPGSTPPHAVLDLPEAVSQQTAKFLEQRGVTGPYAVLHPGSARAEKHWLPQRWAWLLKRLTERFSGQILLTGTSDPHEVAHLREILAGARVPAGRLVDLAGGTPLLTLAAIIKGARFLIGVDSAAVHFAGGFGVPCLSLYGPTNPYHWRVRSAKAWIAQAGFDHLTLEEEFTPKHRGRAMDELRTETVWDGVERIIPI